MLENLENTAAAVDVRGDHMIPRMRESRHLLPKELAPNEVVQPKLLSVKPVDHRKGMKDQC